MIALYSILSLYALWIFFLAVMNVKRVKKNGQLTKTAAVLFAPILLVGYVLDVLVNYFIASFVFLEFPKELTVSARLKRHNRTGSGYRQKLAAWFEQLLDPYDPSGDHI